MKLPQDLRKLISTAEAEFAQRSKIQAAIASTEAEMAQLRNERTGALAQIAEIEAMRALGETALEAPSLEVFDKREEMLEVRLQGLQARLRLCNENLTEADGSISQRAKSFWSEELVKLEAEWRDAAERLSGCVSRIAAFNSLMNYGRIPREEEMRMVNPADIDEVVTLNRRFYDESLREWKILSWGEVPATSSLTKDIEPLTEIRWRLIHRNDPAVIRREIVEQPAEEQSPEATEKKLLSRGWSIFGSAA